MKLFLITLILFTVSSCKEHPRTRLTKVAINDSEVMVVKQKDGIKIEEQIFIYGNEDSLIPNGRYTSYFKNDNIKEQAFFFDGIQDSSFVSYYQNGHTETEGSMRNGQTSGALYHYYPDGKLNSIMLYKDDTTCVFKIAYTENGAGDTLIGKPMINSPNESFDHIKLTDTLKMLVTVLELPKMKTILEIRLKHGNKVLRDEVYKSFSHYNRERFVLFKFAFKQKGNYNYCAVIKLVDSLNVTETIHDSTSWDFVVH